MKVKIETPNDYELNAINFLETHGITFEIVFVRVGRHFANDVKKRDIYEAIFSRKDKDVSFTFGDSVANSEARIEAMIMIADAEFPKRAKLKALAQKKPSVYDILVCLTKTGSGLESLEDFAQEFGAPLDSRQAIAEARFLYSGVLSEWYKVKKFFSEAEIELLKEIY